MSNGKSMKNSLNGNKDCTIIVNSDGKEELSEEVKAEYLELYYQNLVDNFTSESILGNDRGMSLADIYIEPQYRILLTQTTQKDDKYGDRFTSISDDSIHTFVNAYLSKENFPSELKTKDANIVLLLGQPGQGKTSFSKKVMYDYIKDRRSLAPNYFMLRLRDIGNVEKLLDEPIETISLKLQRLVSFTPNLEEETVLFLDGLDELAMKEQLVTESIDGFLETLVDISKDYPKLKIVLTSRTLYVNTEKLSKKLKRDILTLHLHDFSLEKQIEWLEKYQVFYPEVTMSKATLETLHDSENKHILELIAQPILLHMITELNMTYEELTQSTNRVKIYKRMFDSIIYRKWENGKEHENLKGLEPNDIRELLQTIAFEIDKSDYEYIHRSTLQKLTAIKDFYKNLDIDLEETEMLDGILKGVLISFYFQEVQKDRDDDIEDNGNYAIEFMHKSLQEYLVAEKMFDEMLRLIEKDRKKKYFITDYKDVLKISWGLFSSRQISQEIQTYLIDIIENHEDEEEKFELADRLSSFLPELFKKDFLYEFILNEDIYPMKKSLNVFYGYWTVLSNLGTKKNYILSDFNKEFYEKLLTLSTNYFLSFVVRGDINNGVCSLNLSYQQMICSWLVGVHFSNTNLDSTNFGGSRLNDSWFINCSLNNTNFKECDLRGAKMYGCDFRNTNLNNADLRNVEFINQAIHQENVFKNTQLNNILIDDGNAKYLKECGVEFTRDEG